MRSCNEPKEDIRFRMVELEGKLAESEEERRKLEKTCNVLMRAFREEEKMRYKALNKKYEKFLEDCSVRKRRNEIILKSLCRIEDRSKALFAKTERLKLLKDRYVSYLKINDIKQDNVSQVRKNYPSTVDEMLAKSVRWKTPLTLNLKPREEYKKEDRIVIPRKETPHAFSNEWISRSFDDEKYNRERSELFQEPEVHRKNEPEKVIRSSYHESVKNPDIKIPTEIKNEESTKNMRENIRETGAAEKQKLENDAQMVSGADIEGHNESIEKLRQALAIVENEERKCHDPTTRTFADNGDVDLEETEPVSERSKSHDQYQNIDHYGVTSTFVNRDKDSGLLEPMPSEKDSPREKTLPQGLDGVDYQNEIYPESYYEQPVHHHNHTSIASDVILEEDESEQELECGTTTWQQTAVTGFQPDVETSNKSIFGDVAENSDRVRRQESDSEKSSKQSDVAKSSDNEKEAVVERIRPTARSNLIQMLESDSESFQIEHGDEISGHEDSDFDFSFGKN